MEHTHKILKKNLLATFMKIFFEQKKFNWRWYQISFVNDRNFVPEIDESRKFAQREVRCELVVEDSDESDFENVGFTGKKKFHET